MNGWQGIFAKWAVTMWAACWQGALAVGIAWLLVRALGSSLPVQWRPWPWRLAAVKFLIALLPVAGLALPVMGTQSVPESASSGLSAGPAAKANLAGELLPFAPGAGTAAPAPENSDISALRIAGVQVPIWSWSLLFVVWLSGFGWQVFKLYRSAALAESLRWSSPPVTNATLRYVLADLVCSMVLPGCPALLRSKGAGPLLLGWRNPAILIPDRMLDEMGTAELRLVIAHELAHLQRKDLYWSLFMTWVGAAFWFHPFVWLARREMLAATELACDAVTMYTTKSQPAVYGKLLLAVATSFGAKGASPLSVGVAEDANALADRLKSLGSLQARFRQPHKAGLMLALLLVSIVLMPWRLVPRQENSQTGKGTLSGYGDGITSETIETVRRWEASGVSHLEKMRVIRRGKSVEYQPLPEGKQ